MISSQISEAIEGHFLDNWSSFIDRVFSTLDQDDKTLLRAHVIDAARFCTTVLESNIEKKSPDTSVLLDELVLQFFKDKDDYITLRLECGYLVNHLVEEVIVLRRCIQNVLHSAADSIESCIEKIIILNEFLDRFIFYAMENHARLSKIAKQRFLTTINHDTRSPLFAISLGVRRLMKDSGLTEDIAKVASLVSKSAELAIERISDYHDFIAMELGQNLLLSPSEVNMTDLCSEVITEITQIFPDLKIRSHIPDNVWGTWDRSRIRQAVYIVLLNAIQSSENSKHIDVNLFPSRDVIAIDIVNVQGAIDQHTKRVIYSPIMLSSMRVKNKISPCEAERNRMGLYLAREIIHSHFGSISIDQIKGLGTRFGILIPQNMLIGTTKI